MNEGLGKDFSGKGNSVKRSVARQCDTVAATPAVARHHFMI